MLSFFHQKKPKTINRNVRSQILNFNNNNYKLQLTPTGQNKNQKVKHNAYAFAETMTITIGDREERLSGERRNLVAFLLREPLGPDASWKHGKMNECTKCEVERTQYFRATPPTNRTQKPAKKQLSGFVPNVAKILIINKNHCLLEKNLFLSTLKKWSFRKSYSQH